MSGTPSIQPITGDQEQSSQQSNSAQIVPEAGQSAQQPVDNDFSFFKNFKEYVRVITDNERGKISSFEFLVHNFIAILLYKFKSKPSNYSCIQR